MAAKPVVENAATRKVQTERRWPGGVVVQVPSPGFDIALCLAMLSLEFMQRPSAPAFRPVIEAISDVRSGGWRLCGCECRCG